MKSLIDHTNLLGLAWRIVRPYLLETPTIILEEHKLLKETKYVADTLTSFEHVAEYAANVSIKPKMRDHYSGTSVSALICRTSHFKKINNNRRLHEIQIVTSLLGCFINLFSTREVQVKSDYRDVLNNEFHDYKIVNFYRATTHDLVFESFLDMIKYYDEICAGFNFNVVLTNSMLEIFCTMMPSVIAKQYNTKAIVSPSYTYKGLLPIFAAKESSSGAVNLICSAPVSRCFSKLSADVIYNDEAPGYIDFILKTIVEDVLHPSRKMFSTESSFNNDIILPPTTATAKNVFTSIKSFKVGDSDVEVFGYNGDITDRLVSITFQGNQSTYYVVGGKLIESNKAPMDMEILPRFSISKEEETKALTEKENATITRLIRDVNQLLELY